MGCALPNFLVMIGLVTILTIGFSDCLIGERCSSFCKYTHLGIKPEICVNGTCECNPEVELKYQDGLSPVCDGSLYSLESLFNKCTGSYCQENTECVERHNKSDTYLMYRVNKVCICKEGYVRVNTKCRKPKYRKVLENCYIPDDDHVFLCDWRKQSYCKHGKCVCGNNLFANKTSGECEPMENYVQAYNLSSYKVKPTEYCLEDSHCIDGLVCHSFKCDCPLPCKYKSDEEICDCGEYKIKPKETTNVTWPTIIGIILSTLILYFWFTMCTKTKRKYKLKKLEEAGEIVQNDREETTSPESYPLSPVTSSSAGGAPSPSETQRRSSSPRDPFKPQILDSLSPSASHYALTSPSRALYGIPQEYPSSSMGKRRSSSPRGSFKPKILDSLSPSASHYALTSPSRALYGIPQDYPSSSLGRRKSGSPRSSLNPLHDSPVHPSSSASQHGYTSPSRALYDIRHDDPSSSVHPSSNASQHGYTSPSQVLYDIRHDDPSSSMARRMSGSPRSSPIHPSSPSASHHGFSSPSRASHNFPRDEPPPSYNEVMRTSNHSLPYSLNPLAMSGSADNHPAMSGKAEPQSPSTLPSAPSEPDGFTTPPEGSGGSLEPSAPPPPSRTPPPPYQ